MAFPNSDPKFRPLLLTTVQLAYWYKQNSADGPSTQKVGEVQCRRPQYTKGSKSQGPHHCLSRPPARKHYKIRLGTFAPELAITFLLVCAPSQEGLASFRS